MAKYSMIFIFYIYDFKLGKYLKNKLIEDRNNFIF